MKPLLTSGLVAVTLVIGVAGAGTAETGTKTMPDSSVNPPPTPPPVFGTASHRECYLSSDPCDNRHRVNNWRRVVGLFGRPSFLCQKVRPESLRSPAAVHPSPPERDGGGILAGRAVRSEGEGVTQKPVPRTAAVTRHLRLGELSFWVTKMLRKPQSNAASRIARFRAAICACANHDAWPAAEVPPTGATIPPVKICS
jgi:hypothetical protein